MAEITEREQKLVKQINAECEEIGNSAEYTNWKSNVQQIAEYVHPKREYFRPESRASKPARKIYTSVPVDAAQTCAKGMLGYSQNPSSKFFTWRTGIRDRAGRELDEHPQVREYLEQIDRQHYYHLHTSNYYEAAAEEYLDCVALGLGVTFGEWDWGAGVPNWQVRHPLEMKFAENSRGVVNRCYRDYWISAEQLTADFEPSRLTEQLRNMAERTPSMLLPMRHAIFERKDREFLKINAQNKRFASLYIYTTDGRVMKEHGYDVFPGIFWRFRKNAGEWHGVSPAWDCLPEIEMANAMRKELLTALQKLTNPSKQGPESMYDEYSDDPGHYNVYKDPTHRVYVERTAGDPSWAQKELDRSHDIIERLYFVRFFLSLWQAEHQRTAYEIQQLKGELLTLMAPEIGRMVSECIRPKLYLQHYMLEQAGKLPEPPAILREYAKEPLELQFIGPLARALETFLSSQPIRNGLDMIAFYQEKLKRPEIGDVIRLQKSIQDLLKSGGYPQADMATQEEIQMAAEARARAQAAMAQAQGAQGAADIYKGTREAPEEGSPAAGLLRAIGGPGAKR